MNIELYALRDMFDYARSRSWMTADPTRRLGRLKVPHRKPDPPTAEELTQLVATLRGQRCRDAVQENEPYEQDDPSPCGVA